MLPLMKQPCVCNIPRSPSTYLRAQRLPRLLQLLLFLLVLFISTFLWKPWSVRTYTVNYKNTFCVFKNVIFLQSKVNLIIREGHLDYLHIFLKWYFQCSLTKTYPSSLFLSYIFLYFTSFLWTKMEFWQNVNRTF